MSTEIRVGVIGAGHHARALLDHAAPLGRICLCRWAASPGGTNRETAAALAERAGVPLASDWRAVAADAGLRAVLVLGEPSERTEPVIAALRAGHVVLCPPPLATTPAELARIAAAREQGGGTLCVGGEIAHTEAGARGLATIRAAEFGALHSLYVAIRQPRSAGADVLAELGWEALDFILAALSGQLRHAHATGAALFEAGAARDTAVILLRTADDAVITVELSRCLPRTALAPGLGEVEIEAIGAHQAVRIEPHATSVRISRDTGVDAVPWLDAPVIAMLRGMAALVDGEIPARDTLQLQCDALAAMTAIRSSFDATGAIEIEPVKLRYL